MTITHTRLSKTTMIYLRVQRLLYQFECHTTGLPLRVRLFFYYECNTLLVFKTRKVGCKSTMTPSGAYRTECELAKNKPILEMLACSCKSYKVRSGTPE